MQRQEKCPKCGQVSKYELIDYGRIKRFDCPNCKTFRVDKSDRKPIVQWIGNILGKTLGRPIGRE